MRICTNEPIIRNQTRLTRQVAAFWDQVSEGWEKVWGTHIHHGYYEENQFISPQVAQEALIKKLVDLLNISSHANILDVGCGLGGTSIYLAKQFNSKVCGITLSPKQASLAAKRAQQLQIPNVSFKVEDALAMPSFYANTFDIVWSLESCEQFYDKNLFLQQAFRVLKPGGKLLLATWCSDRDYYEGELAKKYQTLCYAFDVPYMPTIAQYEKMLMQQSFQLQTVHDWSCHVKKSWDIGVSLAKAYSFFTILRLAGLRGLRFARQIKLMQEAFTTARVKYGVLVAVKP